MSTMSGDSRALNIFVDATMVKSGQAGIRTYATCLVRALADLPSTRVTCAVASGNDDDWGDAVVLRTSFAGVRPEQRAVWRSQHIPGLVKGLGAEAVLVPAPEPLRGLNRPVGTVVHDLGPLLAPSLYGRTRYLRYLLTLGSTIRRSSLVITPSRATKFDLLRWFRPDPSWIVVAGPRLIPDSARPTRQGGGDFALYVGAMLPHKNVESVIRAFDDDVFVDSMPERLVLVGPDYGGEVDRQMCKAGSRVEHLGFVDRAKLDSLYESARVLVFPTLFEGFGIPLLEALSAGSRVVASDLPVLREVGGDDVTYVGDPVSPEAWARTLGGKCDSPVTQHGKVDWTGAAEGVRAGFLRVLDEAS